MKKCFALRVPVSFTASLIVEEETPTGAWKVAEGIVVSMIQSVDDNEIVDKVRCDFDGTITIAASGIIKSDKA